MAREVRTIRIEDWEGNIYKPEGVIGSGSGGGLAGGTGGASIGSSDIGTTGSGATNTSDGVQTGDPYANDGTAILITSLPSKEKTVASVAFTNLPFGKYSVIVRAKCNKIGTEQEILKVRTYFEDESGTAVKRALSETVIKAKHFDSVQDYTDFGFVTNFTGVFTNYATLRVEVILVATPSVTVSFDNVTISRAPVAVTGTPTVVYKEV